MAYNWKVVVCYIMNIKVKTKAFPTTMTIYARTPAGIAVTKNPTSVLSHELRMLLTSIDGHTKLSAYISILANYGDVRHMFQSLEQSGYIQTVADTALRIDGVQHTTAATSPVTSDNMTQPVRLPELREYTGPACVDAGGDSRVVHAANKLSGSQARQIRHIDLAPVNSIGDRFGHAILLMINFVIQYMPLQSLEISLELEKLTSVEQLVASLPGYEAMIADLGEPAQIHIASLQSTLFKTKV